MTRRGAALVALLAVVAAAAFGALALGDERRAQVAGSWRKAPEPPLSPRGWALGVWTGREALVIGGDDSPPFLPNDDGVYPERPALRDGAAYDPRTRRWRRIADAPLGIQFVSAAVVGRSVFVAVPGNPSRPVSSRTTLLRYRVDRDRWSRVRGPPKRSYGLVEAGDRLVAFGGRPIREGAPGYVLGPGGRSWRALPDDPFPRRLPRGLYWNGRRLVLITTVPLGPDSQGRPLARAATLSLGSREWKRLPDSEEVLYGRLFWVRDGTRLVSPWIGDGSDHLHWGRPLGGILDPERGEWSDAPAPPEYDAREFGTGVLTSTGAEYGWPHGLVLDTARERWIKIPALPSGWRFEIGGATVVAMGRKMLAFGGPRYGGPRGRVVNHAWVWSPPAP